MSPISEPSHSVPDFQNTEIIVNGSVAADGVSQLLVGIQLKNSDNSSVPNYQPSYEIVSGSGVIANACTSSNSNGIAACILRSTMPGTKILKLTNAKVGLTKEIVFSSSQGLGRLNIVSASEVRGVTDQGSKVQFSLGNPIQGVYGKTADGHQVRFSAQGVNR